MNERSRHPRGPAAGAAGYAGAQHDLVIRGSGFLYLLGSLVTLVLSMFFPPTRHIGALGWLPVLAFGILGMALGVARLTLRHQPGMALIHASAFLGIGQLAMIEWLAGGGHAPYTQIMLLSALGSGTSQPLGRCAAVGTVALLGSLSPALYSHIDVASTATEFGLVLVAALMVSVVLSSTRAHRSRLQSASEHANALALHDPLTGLPNRRAFEQTLEDTVAGLSAEHGLTSTILLCDVDAFKQINDRFGHAVGDEMLIGVARALAAAVRNRDDAFRWAGDEFAVILGDAGEAGGAPVAHRVRENVAQLCVLPDGTSVTVSVGTAALRPGMSAESAIAAADAALYRDKARYETDAAA
jgi:diguanylate cyclase (GGDEF)-like protein